MDIPETTPSNTAKVAMALALAGAVCSLGFGFFLKNNVLLVFFLACALVTYIAWLGYMAAQPRKPAGVIAWLAWVLLIGVIDGMMTCVALDMRIEMTLGKPVEFPWGAALGIVLALTLAAWFFLRKSPRAIVLLWLTLPTAVQFLMTLSIFNYLPTVDPSGEGKPWAFLMVLILIGIAAFQLIGRLVALWLASLHAPPDHLCRNCGYDLTGNLLAQKYQCPECGHGVDLELRK